MTRRQLQPCPSPAAYRRHIRHGEDACTPCKKAHAAAIAEHRRLPWKPRDLKPCGTEAAYRRHLKKGEKPCFGCRRAHAAEIAKYTQGKRAAA